MHVAYDGTDYCGWQRQNHGSKPSVQQVLVEALEKIFAEKITLYASGRTDAGVHAQGQVTHFEISRDPKLLKNWDLGWALRPHLPASLSIREVFEAPPEFHATLSATHKTYQYYIYNLNPRPAFMSRYALWIKRPLDETRLQTLSQPLIGKKDFKCFQSVGTPITHTIRTIYQAQWDRPRPHILRFTVTGTGFLKQMVRNIVGTLLTLEKKGQSPEELQEILASLDRRRAGAPAEPQGLFLKKVYYPRELDNKCRKLYNGDLRK